MTYTESIKICKQALDILDIKQFLKIGYEVEKIMANIEGYIEDGDGQDIKKIEQFMYQYIDVFGKPPELFNYMTDGEFLDYCQEKYPDIHWGHETIERHWVSS